MLLLQITGPAHIPWNDSRWQELLYGYDVWVHLEGHAVTSACTSMAKHAATSSNLAALCLHVAHMMRELVSSTQTLKKDDLTQTIALVGKARATAGALNLLRILLHHVLVELCPNLHDVFTYRTRDITERHRADRHTGYELLQASLAFLSSMADEDSSQPWTAVPELYDTTDLCLQLLLVMLSTQLYQPMVSSLVKKNDNYFMDYIMMEARKRHDRGSHTSALGAPTSVQSTMDWTPATVLQTCLTWQLSRPAAPERSIAHHYSELAQSVVQTKEKRVGPDGMYESHVVVMASRPTSAVVPSTTTQLARSYAKPPSRVIWDATRGVLVLSTSLIMLPFRLMSLAFGLWSHPTDHAYDQARKNHMMTTKSRRTNDVLWLSSSPVADLTSALLLLLVHNYRAKSMEEANPFRTILGELGDNRWEADGLNSMEHPLATSGESGNENDSFVHPENALATKPLSNSDSHLATNFESLFESFGNILHTEMGALLLYTLLQSSPTFASFLAVRSDLDTLVMPLLRTLYFSSSLRHYSPHGTKEGDSTRAISLKSCPFRSPSQLYVILILLLLFSQDASFGPDAFRRNIVSSVPWYKERNLRDINLGSLLLLTLLRSITFNLAKMHDAFLLSNCCAVLMNLSHNIVNLHEYAAMRLMSVTMSVLKKYSSLKGDGKGNHQEDDITTPLGMYAEVRPDASWRLFSVALGDYTHTQTHASYSFGLVTGFSYIAATTATLCWTKEC